MIEIFLCALFYSISRFSQGNVYIVDHSILNDISTGHHQGKKLSLAVPMCLLYLRTDNQLAPIAIQLEQGSHNNIATWTPKDEPLDWLLAKMWFRHADLQVHQIRSRYALTNVFGEIFAVAMYRCLPTVHPIYKLLKTHLGSSIPINVLSRKNLISRVRIRSA